MNLMVNPAACFNGDFFCKVGIILNRMLHIPEWQQLLMTPTPSVYHHHEEYDVLVTPSDPITKRVTLRVRAKGEEDYFLLSFNPCPDRHPYQTSLEELFPVFGYVENPLPREKIVYMLGRTVIIPDNMLSEKSLEDRWVDKNGGYHPTYTVEQWQEAVAGNHTRDGYWSYVYQALRAEGLDKEPLQA